MRSSRPVGGRGAPVAPRRYGASSRVRYPSPMKMPPEMPRRLLDALKLHSAAELRLPATRKRLFAAAGRLAAELARKRPLTALPRLFVAERLVAELARKKGMTAGHRGPKLCRQCRDGPAAILCEALQHGGRKGRLGILLSEMRSRWRRI